MIGTLVALAVAVGLMSPPSKPAPAPTPAVAEVKPAKPPAARSSEAKPPNFSAMIGY